MSDNRRNFLKKGALLGLAGLTNSLIGKDKLDHMENLSTRLSGEGGTFTLPKLPYAYDALEPYIDKQTMEIHHNKHHQAYIDKLNAAVTPQNMDFSINDASKCANVDASTPAAIRNNLGGYYNHSLFWTMMKPNPKGAPNMPTGKLAEAITKKFTSFDTFKKDFTDKASKIFGSGWCWLVIEGNNELKIMTTANQDNPLMQLGERGTPVLGLDVWEHAYYLKYQNKRADYINGWWNIVNWDTCEKLYTQI